MRVKCEDCGKRMPAQDPMFAQLCAECTNWYATVIAEVEADPTPPIPWDEVAKALDELETRPAQDKPKLRKLLNEPSPFEEGA